MKSQRYFKKSTGSITIPVQIREGRYEKGVKRVGAVPEDIHAHSEKYVFKIRLLSVYSKIKRPGYEEKANSVRNGYNTSRNSYFHVISLYFLFKSMPFSANGISELLIQPADL